jgi:hypothetical protein
VRRLEEIKGFAAAATPGPWTVGRDEREDAATLRAQPRFANGCNPDVAGKPFGDPIDVIVPFGRAYSDARFIARAREDVPDLVAEIERVRRLAESIVACAESARHVFDELGDAGLRDLLAEIAKMAREVAS